MSGPQSALPKGHAEDPAAVSTQKVHRFSHRVLAQVEAVRHVREEAGHVMRTG